jgi:hypothetical protein
MLPVGKLMSYLRGPSPGPQVRAPTTRRRKCTPERGWIQCMQGTALFAVRVRELACSIATQLGLVDEVNLQLQSKDSLGHGQSALD